LERSGEDALALVVRDGKEPVVLHAAAGAPTARANLSDVEVETLLSNLSAWPESDALTVSESIHRLVEHPRAEERAYQNRGLFSDHYLEHRLIDAQQNPEWAEDISDAYQKFLNLYESKEDVLDELNEAQTEAEFLEAALQLLGWHFIKQPRTEAGKRPDFALFIEERTKNDAYPNQDNPRRFYASALSILEGKYWGRELDQTRTSDPRDLVSYKSSPETQIVGYLQATGMPWGVLTNGKQWRLYRGDAVGKTGQYYSVDLLRALESMKEFRRFYLFFRKEAFVRRGVEGQSFLDRVLWVGGVRSPGRRGAQESSL
jgi:hypothetical protein